MNRPSQQRDDPPAASLRKHQHLPPGTGTLGMILFLMALGMLFAASIIGYLMIRLTAHGDLALGTVHLPAALWASTAIILASSYTIHRALQNVRHERQTPFRNSMTLTLLLAAAFLIVQAPAMLTLLQQHQVFRDQEEGFALYGLIFFLILVHALHVIGGLLPLVVITYKSHANRYDHEHHAPVKHIAMYWHFLDAVWIIMFLTFLFAA